MAALVTALAPICALAQDDPNEMPLGDVARNLRNKKNPPAQPPVIDDDNLTQVMDLGDSRRGFGSSSLRFLMAGESKGFQVAAPDVTCSLSFTANVKSWLSSQYSQMNLPAGDLVKLEGPATIEGDALNVSVFNATNWHVSEVAVALTVVKKSPPVGASLPADTPAAGDAGVQDVRPEKKQDLTVIYRMRAAAPPWARAVFSAPLKMELAPGEEWHWAIVEARGYPPQADVSAATAENGGTAAGQKTTSSAMTEPQSSGDSIAQGPQ